MKKIKLTFINFILAAILLLSPPFQCTSLALEPELQEWVDMAREELQAVLADYPVMALVYLCDFCPVYPEPSYDSDVIYSLPGGQQVQIQDYTLDEDYMAWVQVSFYRDDALCTGWVMRCNLACSDERFISWEQNSGLYYEISTLAAGSTSPDIEQFPASYREALYALKESHPNWTFVAMNTGLDWNTVVANEMVNGRSLIPASFPAYMKASSYDRSWANATRETLEYYLDPRNWLSESYIFQFEQLTYNASYHTESAVQLILNNTFMSGALRDDPARTYANAFFTIGSDLNVSPFHLASRVRQEQGTGGTSPLISGTYAGYEGYYNYFNVGATGVNTEVIINGLRKAVEKGWNSVYASLRGGAETISANYILKGQDTLYLEKFDVDATSNGLYWHQYQQNICAPSSECVSVRNSYSNAGSLDNTFVFKIPVYKNMPDACPKPTQYDIVLTPPAGYTDAHIYLDGICYPAVFKNGSYLVTAPDGGAKTAIMYSYKDNGAPNGMYVWELSYDASYTATAIPEFENLLSYHGFSIRIMGEAGIRFKTGIAVSTREQLLGGGIAGYTLKEYGTLVMSKNNLALYPFVKGGQKVSAGKAYGQNADGTLKDAVFETVDGRFRFTSVLIGLPVTSYQTNYAFRGYIILNKDGKDIILYGAPVDKNIYSLAKQALDAGFYSPGSDAHNFLNQIITDADTLSQN